MKVDINTPVVQAYCEDEGEPFLPGPMPTSHQRVDIDPGLLKDISEELKLQELLHEHRGVHTDDARAKAWADVATKAQTFGDDLVNRWNREIDVYLLFAGLFSAILTAFNVQSYHLLQPGSPEPTLLALERISLQMHSFSINYPFVNSTQPGGPVVRDAEGFPPVAQSAIWLNILWFSGLILSLASALLGIVAKQWLSEYSAVSGNSRDKARLRQYLAKNLVKWRVGDIVLFIPILLVLSLAFFLAGLLVLLWTLHHYVAIVATVLVAVVAVFTMGFALLPLWSVSCAYLSPQSRALYSVLQHTHKRVLVPMQHYLLSVPAGLLFHAVNVPDHIGNVLLWIKVQFDKSDPQRSTPIGWNDRMQSAVDCDGDTLDVEILVTAYEATLDPDAVSSATVCLSDLRSNGVLEYFRKLHESIVKHTRHDHKGPITGGYPTSALLVFHVLLCAIDLSTLDIQEDLCRQVCLDLSSPRHHIAKDDDWGKEELARWLRSVVTWLEPRIDQYLKPMLVRQHDTEAEEEQANASLKAVRNHCVRLKKSIPNLQDPEPKRATDWTKPSLDRPFDLLCRQLYRCQPFVLEQLDTERPSNGPTKAAPGVSAAQLKYLRIVLTFLQVLPTALTSGDDKHRSYSYEDAGREVISELSSVLECYRESLGAAYLEDLGRHTTTSDYLTAIIKIVDALQHEKIFPLVPDELIITFDCIITFLRSLPSAGDVGLSSWLLTHGVPLHRLQRAQTSVDNLRSCVQREHAERHHRRSMTFRRVLDGAGAVPEGLRVTYNDISAGLQGLRVTYNGISTGIQDLLTSARRIGSPTRTDAPHIELHAQIASGPRTTETADHNTGTVNAGASGTTAPGDIPASPHPGQAPPASAKATSSTARTHSTVPISEPEANFAAVTSDTGPPHHTPHDNDEVTSAQRSHAQ